MDDKTYLHMKVINIKSVVKYFRPKETQKRKGKYLYFVDTKREVQLKKS